MPMQFKVHKHEHVPKHEILDEEDVEDVLAAYEIRKEQLPKMLDTDPMTIEMGGRPGDVVRITRKSLTAGKSIAYRIIVES